MLHIDGSPGYQPDHRRQQHHRSILRFRSQGPQRNYFLKNSQSVALDKSYDPGYKISVSSREGAELLARVAARSQLKYSIKLIIIKNQSISLKNTQMSTSIE